VDRAGDVRVAYRPVPLHHSDMTSVPGTRPAPGPRGAVSADPQLASELRRMALHLETAAVLDLRAQRATDPAQVTVLRRRAEQRRREAARIRAHLAEHGVALSMSALRPRR
jgi:hypothetical protein